MADSDKSTYPSSQPRTETSSSPSAHTSPGEDFKDRTKHTAQDLNEAAREQATGLLNQQKELAADQTGKLASVFHKMAEQFDEQDQYYFSSCANNLARSTDVLSERLRDRDIETLLTQAKDYSRRQPAVFIGGAIATGFLLARFMRSSGERNHAQHTPARRDHPQHPGFSEPTL